MKLMNFKGSHVLLLFFLSNLLFLSCSDDNDILKLDAESLKQTSWSGQLIESYNGGEHVLYSEVGIIFYTTETGQYDLKYETDIEPSITEFEYFVDGKLLFIKKNISLGGYWLLVEKSKDRMVLEQSSGGDYSYKATLILERRH
jgi:hypothetical protein